MSDIKQQIVEKLNDSGSILVTVSTNPTVDELSATLGLTLLLNKMNKHATAIFSGEVPAAINFLDPEKTFESTVDSLRDFIIALDKEKADHLRYKVVDDMVKIFITPYRTTITQEDLDFSQGDYNVEMVIAVGVRDAKDLDKALEAHGKILEDAAVVTLSCGEGPASLGGIDWHEARMSSYSEMVMSLVDAMKLEKNTVDEQIATAFLTGLVAATERFSNNKTSSRVMTIAAQLMTQGANQQLIATKLGTEAQPVIEEAAPVPEKETSPEAPEADNKKTKQSSSSDGGSLSISHEPVGTLEEVEAAVTAKRQAETTDEANDQLDAAKEARQREDQAQAAARAEAELAKHTEAIRTDTAPQEPNFGGTLNATTEQAAEESRKALEADKHHKILSHGDTADHGGYIATTPDFQSPLNSFMNDTEAQERPGEQPPIIGSAPTAHADEVTPLPPRPAETLADIDAKHRDARSDIESALREADDRAASLQPSTPPAPVQSTSPTVSATPALPPLPPLPPMPDFSSLPPLPPLAQPPVAPTAAPAPAEPLPPAPKDPGQFRIPGQQ